MIMLSSQAQVLRKRTTMLMGGRFDITLVAKDARTAEMHIDTVIAEIARIEHLISDWIPSSQVSTVNAQAGIAPVKVDWELLLLAERALELSRLSHGAFDISFAAMDRIWKFDGSMTSMPTPEAIRRSVEKVGYRHILISREDSTLYLERKGMKIGFGALGEGYAADRCRSMMQERGIQAGIVNGTGDMSAWGKQPDGSDWMIGINDPADSGRLLAVVPLRQGAVVTSGSYEKFVTFNGKRYAHIINPVTGYPATGLTSVTVFGPSAEQANGLSTTMMVLGKKEGLEFLSNFPEYSCLMVADDGSMTHSPNLDLAAFQMKP
ncbi:FAD:protein FMN transferase [Dyadobacter jejuensis]|nr:FAD:protein FMN transferase [Dyadobacter jejuensis]